jgi:fructose-1,6-bisphosphatase/inositol monophosphatase family enzyme
MNVTLLLQKIQNEITGITNQVTLLRAERSMKDDLSFVTKGDLLINECIERIVREEAAEIMLVSEEKVNRNLTDTSGYIVVVDPIDGTENFTSGLPVWGVSVSCFHNGKHIGSLLGCPEMNLWMKSGDAVPKFFSRIRGLSSSLQMDELIKATQGHEYRILGCCVYNMINVIRGSFLSFENPKGAHSWDILGGLNLALEHNLKVTVNDKPYSGEYLPAGQKYRFRVEHQ